MIGYIAKDLKAIIHTMPSHIEMLITKGKVYIFNR